MKANAIIYFVKYPTAGKVKTRLAKTIGHEKAAQVYRQLALENFFVLRQCQDADVVVYFDPPDDEQKVLQWLIGADRYLPQKGNDLGDRITQAFEWAFEAGYQKVCAYGSDTLQLTSDIVEQGFIKLDTADVVIGPAKDGGYYLIGTSSNQPVLFTDIPWSTADVLSKTQERIRGCNLQCHTLTPLDDMDEVKPGGNNEFIDSQFKKRRS